MGIVLTSTGLMCSCTTGAAVSVQTSVESALLEEAKLWAYKEMDEQRVVYKSNSEYAQVLDVVNDSARRGTGGGGVGTGGGVGSSGGVLGGRHFLEKKRWFVLGWVVV